MIPEKTMSRQMRNCADPKPESLRIGQCIFVQWENYRLEKQDYSRYTSIGWIVRKTDQVIAIASSINARAMNSMYHSPGYILIPIPSIIHISYVSLPNPC
jgi:hypothetical protein